jgi:hypothetical protein
MDIKLYDVPVVFQATVWMNDGQEPIAGGGESQDFHTESEARKWALASVRYAESTEPAPTDGWWYGVIERGSYERTGDFGLDQLDCDWIADETYDAFDVGLVKT